MVVNIVPCPGQRVHHGASWGWIQGTLCPSSASRVPSVCSSLISPIRSCHSPHLISYDIYNLCHSLYIRYSLCYIVYLLLVFLCAYIFFPRWDCKPLGTGLLTMLLTFVRLKCRARCLAHRIYSIKFFVYTTKGLMILAFSIPEWLST